MMILKTTHLILICTWFGLILAETIIELKGSKKTEIAHTSKLHFWIDTCFEIPLFLGVLITGVWMTILLPTLSSLLIVKIIFGGIAIAVNLYCAILVIIRYKQSNDINSLYRWSRKIRWAWLGVPFGLGALYIGLSYFH